VQIEGIHPYEVCETKKNCANLSKDEIEMNNQICTFNGHIYLSRFEKGNLCDNFKHLV